MQEHVREGARGDAEDRGRVLRLRPGVEWQRVDDEVVALDLGSSAYLGVNDSGAVLWPLVAGGTTEQSLVDALTARFPVDAQRARADVGAFVDQLRSYRLVEDA
jgi:hypothetical protein